ncbi:MAG: BatD family protein [Gemmatimonadetes bacterium]|nr:BatD family protein [Gemmatimonadota bacterium]
MVNLLLALAVAIQQPQVAATVNRTEAEVGDEIVVTISVTADGGVPTEVLVPPFSGLDLIGTSQSSVFTSMGVRGTRETTWRYRFRAAVPGRTVIGPIRVRVGSDVIDAGELSVTVTAVGGEGGTEFHERLAEIIAAAPDPGAADDVTVQIIPSSDTIVLGEQLDLVVVAWFPRDVRSRLRTRPTLTPPELQGAWTYPSTAALGVADTRVVDGRRYDLFVHHQVAFPLTAGELRVGHATVSYSLPLRTSILSREMPQEVQSKDTTVVVLPQPLEGMPQPFTGAAARNLEFTVTVDTGDFGMGNASTITAKVTGEGNVSLWPRPEFRWPEGVRVYEGRTAVDIVIENGMIGGTKTFTYLVAPESTGTYVIPPASYRYFALDSGRHVQATAPQVRLVARAVRRGARRDVRPPPIMARRGATALEDLRSRIRLWMLGLIAGLPPLLAFLARVGVAIRRRRRPAGRTPAKSPALEVLEQEFRANLERLVPDMDAREGDGLPAALRAAGVEAPVAIHASRVRDRLWQALYGPEGTSDHLELRAEVHEVLRALPGGRHRSRRMVGAAGLVGALGMIWAGAASAQSTTAEQLYEAGAFRAAADSFLIRASQQPADPSQWFNAGAALFGAGEETAARVAWVKAARVAPRNPRVGAALQLVPPVDSHARANTWIAPVTVMELALVGTILWVVGWLTYTFSARPWRALPVAAFGLVVACLAAYLHDRYTEPVGLVLVPNAAVREAPYGTALATTRFAQGAAVRIERSEGAWLLVRRGGYQGWVLSAEVGRL